MTRFLPRLRFSLRTLLVVMTLLSAFVGYHVHWIRQRHEALEWLAEHGQIVFLSSRVIPRNDHPAPLALRIFGEQGIAFIVFDLPPDGVSNAEFSQQIEELTRLFPEADVIDPAPFLRNGFNTVESPSPSAGS